ncbi:carboxymuconolactone decarboxylase family protein [Rhodococcus aetherivorans]|uniref:carboxymuconolactone decarboxylase family protein n=1 Tax=Rhodococcus aetherivorans TaxID=191292 RepID=UPI00241E75E4|nr:carboxymuconolactone decarboxylase family protein [Rhodococcus aetherivorans]WFS11358.1 carboxymuconolactone decarboxylase family protein [Rhodococcus aetherivorans]
MPTTFTRHSPETAPPAARPIMSAIGREFGFVPDPVALMAESPELLSAFTRANALFERSSLGEIEREVLVLTIATRNECHVCVALHSAKLARMGAPGDLVDALRTGRALADERLEVLRRFTLAVLDSAGAVPDDRWAEFTAAGFTARNALEVVLGAGTFTLSTLANRLTAAELDPPLAPFAWRREEVAP